MYNFTTLVNIISNTESTVRTPIHLNVSYTLVMSNSITVQSLLLTKAFCAVRLFDTSLLVPEISNHAVQTGKSQKIKQ